MALKGKFVRREGTSLIFGSRAKPEWRPIEISGHIDPMGLEQGSYYELETSGNSLTGYRKLDGNARDHAPTDRAQMETGARTAGSPGNATSGNLMASATGFAKSAMEGGLVKTVPEAIRAGLAWGRLWGQVPADPADSRPQPTRNDFDEDEPF